MVCFCMVDFLGQVGINACMNMIFVSWQLIILHVIIEKNIWKVYGYAESTIVPEDNAFCAVGVIKQSVYVLGGTKMKHLNKDYTSTLDKFIDSRKSIRCEITRRCLDFDFTSSMYHFCI